MSKKTLQVLTISRDGVEYVFELRSVMASMPALPVSELRFETLEELWMYIGQWFISAAQVAEMFGPGPIRMVRDEPPT